MGRGTLLRRKASRRSTREGGWSLVELTITLFLLMAIALFGLNTMVSGFNLQNWSIGQSMTDAYAEIETAYAQRKVFADIPTDGRWQLEAVYPPTTAPVLTPVTIGYKPSAQPQGQPVNATVMRIYYQNTDPVTSAVFYLLESYVVYQDGQRKYCKVSKVYRNE